MRKMKTERNWLIIMLLILFTSITGGCSKKDNDPKENKNSFVLDGVAYSVNITSLQSQNDGSGLSIASIIMTGNNESKVGTLTFLVHYYTTEGITGTYTPAAGIGSGQTYTPHLTIYSIQNGAELKTGAYPEGEVKITSHGGTEYSLEFDLIFSDGVKASANVKRSFPTP